MMDWKDPKNRREPVWPVGGFAPGEYMGKCQNCEQSFVDMDKRAHQCLPCAIDMMSIKILDLSTKLRAQENENRTLRAAFQILNSPDKET